MSDTFLLQPTWTYIDQQAELLSDAGSIRIVDECWNTGTREPGKRLRRRVLNLLPDVEEPITIDFNGVESTSSLFHKN